MDCRGACMVPLYKGKVTCMIVVTQFVECIVGKLYSGVLNRVRAGTECAIEEELIGLRHGRGCLNQVFTAREVCEKSISN